MSLIRYCLLLPALSLLAVGCGDDFGEACSLPTLVAANCQQASTRSQTNCVMTDNLDCGSKICVVFESEGPFCSEGCSSDGDCSDGASCVSFFLNDDTDKYCVPKKYAP